MILPDQFLTSFEWDGAKNPTHRPIKKIVQELRENAATIDEELKVKTSEYAAAKAQLSGISRKTGGSLATRDLGDIVQESDVSFFCCSTSSHSHLLRPYIYFRRRITLVRARAFTRTLCLPQLADNRNG